MLKTKGLRIISDIHYDSGINKESFESTFNNAFNKSKGIVTLIAGDLAANLKNEKEFLEKYFNNKLVFFTEGNHMVYCRSLKTIYELEEERKKEFPLTHPFWKYLNNNWDWIPGTNESIAIIGSIFYTDYEYHTWTVDSFNEYLNAWTVMGKAYGLNYEEEKVTSLDINRIIEENQFIAQSYLNDFNWGYEAPGKNLTPYTYRELHLKSKKEVLRCYNEIIAKNPKAKVILMTHHCLSPKCIDEKFINKKTNASYVSDLEDWICKEMPNIRLIISGHVHCRKDFLFGKDNKRYIVNACGYIPYNEPFEKIKFNPNLIIRLEDL